VCVEMPHRVVDVVIDADEYQLDGDECHEQQQRVSARYVHHPVAQLPAADTAAANAHIRRSRMPRLSTARVHFAHLDFVDVVVVVNHVNDALLFDIIVGAVDDATVDIQHQSIDVQHVPAAAVSAVRALLPAAVGAAAHAASRCSGLPGV